MIILYIKTKHPAKNIAANEALFCAPAGKLFSFELSSDVGSCALLEKAEKLKVRAKPNPIQQYGQTRNCHRVSKHAGSKSGLYFGLSLFLWWVLVSLWWNSWDFLSVLSVYWNMPGFFVETAQSGFPEFLSASQAIRSEISLEKINAMVFGSQSKSNWLSIILEQSISTYHSRLKSSFQRNLMGLIWIFICCMMLRHLCKTHSNALFRALNESCVMSMTTHKRDLKWV